MAWKDWDALDIRKGLPDRGNSLNTGEATGGSGRLPAPASRLVWLEQGSERGEGIVKYRLERRVVHCVGLECRVQGFWDLLL